MHDEQKLTLKRNNQWQSWWSVQQYNMVEQCRITDGSEHGVAAHAHACMDGLPQKRLLHLELLQSMSTQTHM